MKKKGLIQVYTSGSEKFNFAPIGLALRAAGHDLHTLIICFTPHELMNSSTTAAALLAPNLVVDHTAIERASSGRESDGKKALRSLQKAKEAAVNGDFDLLVLNGVFQLVEQGLVGADEIMDLMEDKDPSLELILSGTKAAREIMDRADLVTEMSVHNMRQDLRIKAPPIDGGGIEVVTGKGKGKTTYCLGKALLTSCMKIPSFILQAIKSPKLYGEVKAIGRLPYLEIRTMGEGFINKDKPEPEKKHRKAAREAWELWLREIYSMKYGLLVLDEINIATHYGLIHVERVKEMLFLKPKHTHLLLSGRNAHPEVTAAASTVIEMKEIKHPFKKGVKARKGVEF